MWPTTKQTFSYLSSIDDAMVYFASSGTSASSAGPSSPSLVTPCWMTVPSRLHMKVMLGAPVALQLRVATSPLSEADFALAGDSSILGASKNIYSKPFYILKIKLIFQMVTNVFNYHKFILKLGIVKLGLILRQLAAGFFNILF